MSTFNTFQQYSTDFGLGNNGLKITLNYFDGLPDPGLIQAIGSNNMVICFKSLLKRDEHTREKALLELAQIVGVDEQTTNEVTMLLWTQIYPKMLISEMKTIRALAHEITCKFIVKWGKKISKYLKDLIPLLMSGLYDTETYVSKQASESIVSVFNSVEKIENLWEKFIPQHSKLIHEIIVVETRDTISDEKFISKENSNLRYARLITTSVYMMIHLLKKYPAAVLKDPNFLETLNQENIWDYLSLSKILENGTKPTQVLLQLINILDEVSDEHFNWEDNKGIFKIISKKLLKFIGKISSKNILKVSPLFTQILHTLNTLSYTNDGKLWTYDKNSKQKLQDFMNLGPGPATSIEYYDEAYKLIGYKQDSLFTEEECFSLWSNLVDFEIERPGFNRNSKEFLTNFWTNYLHFITDSNDGKSLVVDQILKTIKKKNITRNTALVQKFASHIPPMEIRNEILKNVVQLDNELYVDNLFSISWSQSESDLSGLSTALIESILEHEDLIADNMSFKFFKHMIEKNLLEDSVIAFMYELPTYVTEDFYSTPNDIVVSFTKSKFANNEKTIEILSDYILVLLNLNISKDEVLKTVCSFDTEILKNLKSKSIDLREFMDEYIDNFTFHDATLFQSTFISLDLVLQLHQKAVESKKLGDFYELSLQLPNGIKNELYKNTTYLQGFRAHFKSMEWLQKLLPFIKADDEIACNVSKIIFDLAVGSTEFHDELLKELSTVVDYNSMCVSQFLDFNISKIETYIKQLDSNVSLVSSLGLATHLIPSSENAWTKDVADITHVLNFGLFIDSFLTKYEEYLTDDLILFLTLIFEISQDFNCITCQPNDNLLDISNVVYKTAIDFDIKNLLLGIVASAPSTGIVQDILDLEDNSTVVGYYKCRILYNLMNNSIDSISSSQFESNFESSMPKYIASQIRSKHTTDLMHLKNCVLLLSLEKFASLDMVGKIRNMLSAELIGSNSKEMLTSNYKTIIYLNCLLSSNEEYVPVQPQRIQMVLTSISKLFDDEDWYLDDFGTLRLCIVQFFSHLVKFENFSDNDFFNASLNRLLSDMLSMCQINETPYILELRDYTIELYKNLHLYGIHIEESGEIHEALLEILFTKYPSEKENQINIKFFKTFSTVLQELDVHILEKFYERLLDLLKISSVNISQLRVGVMLLEKIIKARQETLVVDFELSKQKLSSPDLDIGDDEISQSGYANDGEQFKIAECYINILKNEAPTDYLEYSDEKLFLRYLWALYLLVQHFSNISYNLRHFYFEQLKKEENLLDNIYSFMAEEIQGDETFTDYNIGNFAVYKDELVEECKKVLVFDLYSVCSNFGVATSNWYLNIKSRQLQIKIEKFISTNISPILISRELKDCSEKIEKIKEGNDALSIKFNEKLSEIRASYLIDEQKLEIAFKFPSNYPLNCIQVIGVSRIGVTENKWKSWILSTQRVITSMNGSILDSLELFSKNVDLQFSGFEECAICYYVLNAIDRKLPTKQCPTCNYKFHSACLYKWFKSSGNNTCPMCRGAFDFNNRSTQGQQVR